jgi:tetratricopeptide (TPR) repeat protein
MDQIMVLTTRSCYLSILLLSLFLTACSGLPYSSDSNRLPEQKVVPAIGDTSSTTSIRKPPQTENARPAQQSPVETPAPPDSNNTEQTSSAAEQPSAVKKADIMNAILQQASKAIENQQWLRAQHHLEHALRISPRHALTFFLYAQVYQGMGAPEKATEMLKRSLFLSKPDSELHNTIKQQLQARP